MIHLTRRALIASLAALPIAARAGNTTAYDFSLPGIDGQPIELANFRGQPILVVNTASRCGFTYQYTGLQALYDRYRDQGLIVLGAPSNDFGGQELATEAKVKKFCEVNFSIDFPMTEILAVRGSTAHPFYRWARETLGQANAPRWNFHKYLIGPEGSLVGAYDHRTEPQAAVITREIERILSA